MMECHQRIILSLGFMVVMMLTALICATEARPPRIFHAGGRDGWTLMPDDGLNRWASKRRFRINDTIVFEYEKGKDSVLVVRKRAYYHCNKTSPIQNMTDGFSKLKFTTNRPFYFISGYANNCQNGQKLRLVVMSPNHHHPSPPPTPPPSLPPSPSPAPPPPSSTGDGWIKAPAPPKNSSPTSAVISWGLTMVAGFLICLV